MGGAASSASEARFCSTTGRAGAAVPRGPPWSSAPAPRNLLPGRGGDPDQEVSICRRVGRAGSNLRTSGSAAAAPIACWSRADPPNGGAAGQLRRRWSLESSKRGPMASFACRSRERGALATPTQVRRRARTGLLGATIIGTALVLGMLGGGAFGASVTSASFSGGANTVVVGAPGTLYAKQGATVTLTVATSSDTKCVELTGAHTALQGASAGKSDGRSASRPVRATAFRPSLRKRTRTSTRASRSARARTARCKPRMCSTTLARS